MSKSKRPTLAQTIARGIVRRNTGAQIREYLNAASDPNRYRAYFNDPLGYLVDVLSFVPTTDQLKVVKAVPGRVKVNSGHSTGKTAICAGLANWWWDTRNPGVVITTAPTERDVVDLLWTEIRLQRMRANLPTQFVGPRAPAMFDHEEHWAKGYTARKAESFHGRHRENMMFIFDESEGIDAHYWIAADTMFQPDQGHCFLAIGNPLTTSSQSYREDLACQADGKPKWEMFTLSSLNHPNIAYQLQGYPAPIPAAVSLGQVQQWVQDWCSPVQSEDAQPGDIEWPPRMACIACMMGHSQLESINAERGSEDEPVCESGDSKRDQEPVGEGRATCAAGGGLSGDRQAGRVPEQLGEDHAAGDRGESSRPADADATGDSDGGTGHGVHGATGGFRAGGGGDGSCPGGNLSPDLRDHATDAVPDPPGLEGQSREGKPTKHTGREVIGNNGDRALQPGDSVLDVAHDSVGCLHNNPDIGNGLQAPMAGQAPARGRGSEPGVEGDPDSGSGDTGGAHSRGGDDWREPDDHCRDGGSQPGAASGDASQVRGGEGSGTRAPGTEPRAERVCGRCSGTGVIAAGKHFRPGPVFKARALGLRPVEGIDTCFGEREWGMMIKPNGDPSREWQRQSGVTIGVDVATYGDDDTCFHARIGSVSVHHESRNGWLPNRTAERIFELCTNLAHYYNSLALDDRKPLTPEEVLVVIEVDGPGIGVQCLNNGWNWMAVKSAERADATRTYVDRRSEMWFAGRDAARGNGIDITRLEPGVKQRLREQLMTPSYSMDGGRLRIESKKDYKKRLGRSPDDADAFLLSQYRSYQAFTELYGDEDGSFNTHHWAKPGYRQ